MSSCRSTGDGARRDCAPGRGGRQSRRAAVRSAVYPLVVEDNIVNQKIAVGLLTRRGHDVTIAQDGGEALARLEQETFDVVLMDLQMPEDERHRRDRGDPRARARLGATRAIVAMTAHAMTGDRERCLNAGMDGYVSKPIDPLLFALAAHGPAPCISPQPGRRCRSCAS